MKPNRRHFITPAIAGSMAAALPLSSCGQVVPVAGPGIGV
jgi:hypothetical protein